MARKKQRPRQVAPTSPSAQRENVVHSTARRGKTTSPVFPGFESSRVFWGLWALAAFLRIATVTRNAVWYDELMNMRSAENVTATMFTTSLHWLHFFVLRVGLAINDGPLGLRLFPLVFGIATFPFFYALGNLIGKRTCAAAFGILFALSQYHIFYSQDGNYYSEMMFYTVLAAYLLVAGVMGQRLWVVALSLVAHILSFLTHPFSAVCFVWMAVAAAMILLTDRRTRSQTVHLIAFWRHGYIAILLEIGIISSLVWGVHFLRDHAGLDFWLQIQQMWELILKSVRLGATPWNMEFNTYFFTRTL